MIVFGNIAGVPEKKIARESQKEYYTLRLAENQGKDANKSTTWYDVVAFISEMEADMLNKGMLVKVMGVLTAETYQRKSDSTWTSALKIRAFKVEPYEPKPRQQDGDGGQG
jgi:single-stranded DNA-binding protein